MFKHYDPCVKVHAALPPPCFDLSSSLSDTILIEPNLQRLFEGMATE